LGKNIIDYYRTFLKLANTQIIDLSNDLLIFNLIDLYVWGKQINWLSLNNNLLKQFFITKFLLNEPFFLRVNSFQNYLIRKKYN